MDKPENEKPDASADAGKSPTITDVFTFVGALIVFLGIVGGIITLSWYFVSGLYHDYVAICDEPLERFQALQTETRSNLAACQNQAESFARDVERLPKKSLMRILYTYQPAAGGADIKNFCQTLIRRQYAVKRLNWEGRTTLGSSNPVEYPEHYDTIYCTDELPEHSVAEYCDLVRQVNSCYHSNKAVGGNNK